MFKSLVASGTRIVSVHSLVLLTPADTVAEVVAFASGLCEAYPKESRVFELKIASIVTILLATIFLFLRLYSRWLKTRRLWSDDAYAIIAAVSL